MNFEGSFIVDAPREEVWPYFNDPDILQECAPGCKEMVLESPSEIRTTLEVGVGSVKPTFDVDAVVVECTEPSRLEIRGSGEASRNSFSVTAWQELSDNGDGTTTVDWHADAEVSGVIASLGERALESVTNKLVTDFFEDIEAEINAGTPAEAKLRAADAEQVEAAEQAAAERAEGGLLDDVFAAVGSLGGDTGDDGAAGSGSVGLSLGAGVVGGLVGAALWSRLGSSGGDDARGVAVGSETGGTAGGTGGRLRYVLLGAVLGAAGTFLLTREDDSDGRGAVAVDSDGVSVTDAGSTADSASPSTASVGGAGSEPERGLIDDPLDRLE